MNGSRKGETHMKVAFVSCTKLKEDLPCRAKDMYLKSTLFKKATKYIEANEYDNWFILSAKYGLLKQEDIIEPYDETLNSMKKSGRITWANKVMEQIQDLNINIECIDFYAGQKYREYLIPMLQEKGIQWNVPLEGKGIGEQLAFYTSQNT